jgi:hypothetical protein
LFFVTEYGNNQFDVEIARLMDCQL